MRIKVKIILFFLCASIFLLLITTLSYYTFATKLIRKNISSQLKSVAKAKAETIRLLLNQPIQHTKDTLNHFEKSLEKLQKNQATNPTITSAIIIKHLSSASNNFQPSQKSLFVGKNNRIIFSNIPALYKLKGTIFSNLALFDTNSFNKIKNSSNILIDIKKNINLNHNQPFLMTAGSLYHQENYIGTLFTFSSPNTIFITAEDRTGLGKTGETYIVGTDFYMRTDSRFYAESTIQKQLVKTYNIINGFKHSNTPTQENAIIVEVTGIFDDYRKVPVMGANAYIPEANWVLAAEIDKYEALQPIYSLFKTTLIINMLAIIALVIAAYYIGQYISKPIEDLRHGAEIIEKGNLDFQVATTSNDEVGQLSRSFDKMTTSLLESYTNLEDKVTQRTAELAKSNKELNEALNNVKTLSGLLPICMSCKKIRDDQGYWKQIENYIKDHSEANFSHSLCPECAKKLYPTLFDENGKVKKKQ